MIKMREVTPLSRLLALILFIGVIPVIFFYLGMQYQATQDTKDLMQTYNFPRLQNYSGRETGTTTEASTSLEIAL
jgi:hypothetical protein